jgi:enamine deaminase RidA (YjgF/YER057c/UK114 family)
MTAVERLAEWGLSLPSAPAPAAAYRPWVRDGAWIVTAGQLPTVDGELAARGHLGDEITTAEGIELARIAGLNVLAVLAAATDLDAVRLLKVQVFVASVPAFDEQHLVANGASELFAHALGERGTHARSAVGVAALPLASPIEIDAVATTA